MSARDKVSTAYWRNTYEELVRQTGRDLNDGYGVDPRKARDRQTGQSAERPDLARDEPTPTPTDGADPLELRKDSGSSSGSPSSSEGASDPVDLAKLEEVARRLDDAQGNNGHCGEGHFESRQRRNEAAAAYKAFTDTFDPLTVRLLIQMARGKS